jgi:hypothetical protein
MNSAAHNLLTELGADLIPHQKGSLYNHLSRVEKLLTVCECQQHVVLAGLFHSIYGNEIFKIATTDNRLLVQNTIGLPAENLAWLFCNIKRPDCYFSGNVVPLTNGSYIHIDDNTMKELKMIEGANILDHNAGTDLIKLFGFDKTIL